MVLHHLPAPGAGGLEGQVHDLCAGLLSRGVDVRVVCRPSLYLPAATVPLLERTTALPADRPPTTPTMPATPATPATPDTAFLEMWRTSQELAEAEEWTTYDVVHVQSHYGYHAAMHVAGTPSPRPALVTTFHLSALGGMLRLQELGLAQEPDVAMTQPAAAMEATLARVSDHCIAVSQQVRNDLRRGYGVAKERVSVVYNGVDTDLFAPVAHGQAQRQLGLDPALRYVLYVGPFFGFRGRTLLDSLPLLDPDVRVLAIWPSDEAEPPGRRGDALIQVGYVPRDDMPTYYAAAELLAYPLVYTGFGLTLIEASACGCVPVAFDLPPASELLPDTAWLVDEITPRAFAHAINAALRDPDTARKSREGIERARSHQFTGDHMVDQTLAAYDIALETANREDSR